MKLRKKKGKINEVEEEEENKKEVEEEEGKNKEVEDEEEKKEVEEEEEKNEVEEEEEKINVVKEDGIKTVNAHTFPVHFQPNATGDSILQSAMRKYFDSFRTILQQNGLKCHSPSEKQSKNNHGDERKEKHKQDTTKKHKESLCLLWYVHNVLFAKDVNNNIPLKLVKLSEDIEAFNNYSWGHDNYELTVKYLLDPLSPKTNNLFGFQWTFMTWAFEVTPHLRHQVTAEEEISSPRILRWLRAKNVKNPLDLFNPPHDAVVHPWLVPTEKELQMSYIITVGLVETLFDLVVDIVKRELLGATTIKRARLDGHQLFVFNEDDMVYAAVRAGVGG
ncbi:hypothetical protein KY285_010796 [Solanum tuberosum]|nr:hypothetical protein KY289_012799 [Solanum tuberosum]KAH0735089.1 hypothetical protein KY285_010796 [Solanum tuberosum]